MLDFTSIPERDRVIVALDCDRGRALELADMLSGKAAWLKVGMTLFYQEGPYFINALQKRGFKVFLDLKFHDIPIRFAERPRRLRRRAPIWLRCMPSAASR